MIGETDIYAAAAAEHGTPLLLVTGDGHSDVGELWGYLVTVLLILPFAAAWAFAERSRWSSVVMVLAAVTVIFLEYRLVQIWER